MSNHTPTPWAFTESTVGYTGHTVRIQQEGEPRAGIISKIIGCYTEEAIERYQQDFAHIVKCVNAHDELVVTLQGMVDNACAAAEIEDDQLIIRCTKEEWSSHVKATAKALTLLTKLN